MSQDLVAFAIGQSQSKGAEYAEARYQKTSELSCLLRNGTPEPATMIDAEGMGVRIIFDGALAFGATNQVSKERISALVDRLVSNAKSASRILKEKIHFSSEDAHVSKWFAEEQKKVEDVSVESMISLLKEIDSTPQIGRQQIPVRDLAFLQKIMHRASHLVLIDGRLAGSRFGDNPQPVRFRQPADPGAGWPVGALNLQIHLLFAALELPKQAFGVHVQDVAKQIGLHSIFHRVPSDGILRMQIGEKNLPAAVRHQERFIHSVEQTGHQPE